MLISCSPWAQRPEEAELFNKAGKIAIGHKAELLDCHGDKEKRGTFSIIFQR
jgi:hypothetical protein